jgi:hypothetical protein
MGFKMSVVHIVYGQSIGTANIDIKMAFGQNKFGGFYNLSSDVFTVLSWNFVELLERPKLADQCLNGLPCNA